MAPESLDLEQLWDELNRQPVHQFADWPNRDVPKVNLGFILFIMKADGSTLVCPLRICRADYLRMLVGEGAGISFVCMWGIAWLCPS